MRIGFFAPTLNRVGGGELIALNMIRALQNKGHRIIVYTAEKTNRSHIQEFLGYDLSFDEIGIGPNIFDPYAFENIYPNALKSYLLKLKCDLLIDTFSNSVLPWTDVIYFQGNSRIVKLPRGFEGVLFAPYKYYVLSADKQVEKKVLLTCSMENAKKIRDSVGLNVRVVYPPVSSFFKIHNNAHPKDNTVVTVARISNDKRPETIPLIAKLILEKNVSFTIVGNCRTPNEQRTLRNLLSSLRKHGVEKKVKLLLNVSREKQREVLQKAKIYLHPFVPYESFGLSAVEAMSAGCVPIVPDVGGLKEIVPEQLRYNSVEGAAALVDSSLGNWTESEPQDYVRIADRFSPEEFYQNFLKYMPS